MKFWLWTLGWLSLAQEGPLNLSTNQEYLELTHGLTDKDYILMDFYAPWCNHCKRLSPQLDIVAKIMDQWNENDTKTAGSMAEGLKFGVAKLDCTQAKRACTNAAIYSYPTLHILSKGSKPLAEYPQGPRLAEHLLAFVATYTKLKKTVDIKGGEAIEGIVDHWFKRCRTTESADFDYYVCLGQQSNNLLVGMQKGLKKMLKVNPKLAETHILVELLSVSRPLTTEEDVCWVDTWTDGLVDCLSTKGSAADKRLFNQRYLAPLYIKDATWGHFFHSRNRNLKSTMVVALRKDENELAYEAAFTDFAREYRKDIQLLFIDAADQNIMKLLHQLNVDTTVLPTAIVFTRDPEDRGYWVMSNTTITKDALVDWFEGMKSGKLAVTYPDNYQPGIWPFFRRQVKALYAVLKEEVTQSAKRRMLMVAVVLTLLVGSLSLCYFTLEDEGVDLMPPPHHKASVEDIRDSKSEARETEVPDDRPSAGGARRRRRETKDTSSGSDRSDSEPFCMTLVAAGLR
eukprot:Blabericola_migrator_1__9293@NODE_49_length_16431_cov_119_110181_g45_i0_p5_GENE_NODE_49_length_16431_cov_119_110181_g45_i0NODE_49_length_16431_cov_119_110181_g45_i0_p5_ORF_typecomplete_len513_score110_65Thioredoxin/PF00085_20/2e16Thioredoxin/PF00085_20/17Thioredoxin_6/PF13848_6/4_8e03Thioredoxin_6/PF13848_6/1_8e06Thioredoxin_8/PF13905_6/0_0063Thioredoxin_8/PF13905_6/34OST3_OST6/PF04756_13/0_062OST3_OST6/PF04756_13/1_5Thioredoxin_2/PF13098_6/0_008Thioredoxin_2/PF13098_6/1_7e03TraF/PF13728_6/0_059